MTTQTIRRPLSHWALDIAVRESVPLGWLANVASRIKTEVPDSEESTCMVYGLQHVTVSWEHTLTDVEQLQATVAEMQRQIGNIKTLLPIEGGVSPAVADKLRELLK